MRYMLKLCNTTQLQVMVVKSTCLGDMYNTFKSFLATTAII